MSLAPATSCILRNVLRWPDSPVPDVLQADESENRNYYELERVHQFKPIATQARH